MYGAFSGIIVGVVVVVGVNSLKSVRLAPFLKCQGF